MRNACNWRTLPNAIVWRSSRRTSEYPDLERRPRLPQ
jgi:hypothetical protein